MPRDVDHPMNYFSYVAHTASSVMTCLQLGYIENAEAIIARLKKEREIREPKFLGAIDDSKERTYLISFVSAWYYILRALEMILNEVKTGTNSKEKVYSILNVVTTTHPSEDKERITKLIDIVKVTRSLALSRDEVKPFDGELDKKMTLFAECSITL